MLLSAVAGGYPSLPINSWPMYQYSPSHNAVFSKQSRDVSWRFDTKGKINGALAAVGGTIYAESFDHRLYAIAADSGKLEWSTDVGGVVMNAPIVDGDTVIVGTGVNTILSASMETFVLGVPDGDYIVALDRTNGSIKWRYHTIGENMPSGAISGDLFAFPTGDDHVVALDKSTGAERWRSKIPGVPAMASLAILDGTLFGGSHVSYTFWLSAFRQFLAGKDFNYRNSSWTWSIRASDGQLNWISPYGSGDCSPTIGDGIIAVEEAGFASLPGSSTQSDPFAVATSGRVESVYGINAMTGTLVWQYTSAPGPIDSRGSEEGSIATTFADGAFFASLQYSREFAAFNASDGRLLWNVPTQGGVKMSAIVANGRVYVGDNSGVLYVLDQKTGGEIQKVPFPQGFSASPPLLVGNSLYIANGPSVYALRTDDLSHPPEAPIQE